MMIEIRAGVENRKDGHRVALSTNGRERALEVPPKAEGRGSSANGGELLFLALATCYVNDVFREAARRGVEVDSVAVEVRGRFGDAPGSVAEGIEYDATVRARAPEAEIVALMRHTDTVAEVQNTLRRGTPVVLVRATAIDAR
jgi:uncharacterized OsmC-like protein